MASSFRDLFRKKGKRAAADEEEGGLAPSNEPPRRRSPNISISNIFGSSNDETRAPAASTSREFSVHPILLAELTRQTQLAFEGSRSGASRRENDSDLTPAASQSKGATQQDRGDHKKVTMVLDNSIKVMELTKAAADATSIGGPIKAACGVTQIVLQTVKVSDFPFLFTTS
jgi:hypothetical protein